MRRLGLVGLAGVALGLTAEWVGFGWGDPRRWIPDLAVGWTLIGCGLVAVGAATGEPHRPAHGGDRVHLVLWGTSATSVWRRWPGWRRTWCTCTAGPLCSWCSPTHPGGRRRGWSEAAVAVGYAAAVITPIWRSEGATILLAALLLAVCARDYVRAVGRARRARRAALQAVAGLSVVLAGTAAARLLLPAGRGQRSVAARVRGDAVRACRLAAGRPAGGPLGSGRRDRPGRRARRGPHRHAPRRNCHGRWATRRWRSATGLPDAGGVRRRRGPHALHCPIPVRGAR